MDTYKIDESFEEDTLPSWRQKELDDAKLAEEAANRREKIHYNAGDQVGNFLFVRYMKYKNRAIFQCPECGKKFQYNVYTIKNKRRCKWYKGHNKR